MAQATSRKKTNDKTDSDNLTKKELQQQIEKTRESVSETVGEIKETVSKHYEAAKDSVVGVLDFRKQFQDEPLVWSLGALSAGFALGYTMGYAHKDTRSSRSKSQVSAFTNSLVDELSVVGNSVVMPTLNARIKELFGFDFSEVLNSISKARKTPKRKAKKARAKTGAKIKVRKMKSG